MSAKSNEPIAVVGSACRFAGGVTSPAKLWELLKAPRDVSSEIPDSRFRADGFYHPDGQHHGRTNVKNAYVLAENPGAFDAEFFGVKPVEAKALDPQQRLLLETVYEGLEAAGIPVEDLRGSNTGVYVGLMSNDYEAMMLRGTEFMAVYHTVGTQRSILANRISYFYDWHGPSMVVDTACSSSLVAVHLAVQALRAGEARTVLACGSNLLLGPENFIGYSKLKMLSPDGKSMMWDQNANGYARGEGVAALVLKPLSAALKDGDHIECIIRETGTNQDGATPGITMPSPTAQMELIRDTYRRAHLDPREKDDRCHYFEAHGTGTQAGDPVEARAIHGAFFSEASDGAESESLYVGSIKTIIGHTEGTAGIASILKASLSLQKGLIPPNLSFHHLNPMIAPFYRNLRIPTLTPKEWPSPPNPAPRRASVNSFGFGGANAHAILESFDGNGNGSASMSPNRGHGALFTPCVFSAHSEKSLRANLMAYSELLGQQPLPSSLTLRDLAGTLRQRRSVLPVRAAISAASLEELKSSIDSKLQGGEDALFTKALPSSFQKIRVLGVFTGQGAHALVRTLDGYLADLPNPADRPSRSLEAEILADASSSRVSQAAISQPVCTAIQIVLVELLRLANVTFCAVVGHSSGEIAAAYAAGYLTARDAIRIAYYRGLHSKPPPGARGAMLAVGASLEEAEALCAREDLDGKVAIAASNSSSSVTLSGDEDAIAAAEEILGDQGKFMRRLRVDQAYHSHHMVPCSEPYRKALESCRIQVQQPSGECVWFSSTHSGQEPIENSELQGSYWVANMVKPVLFSQALTRALSPGGFDLALEVGPHPALKGPAMQTINEVINNDIPYHGMLARGTDAIQATSDALGFLWSRLGKGKTGIDLDRYEREVGGGASAGQACFNIVKGLPPYQWDHDKIYWHESRISRSIRLRTATAHPLLGDVAPDSSPHQLSWRNMLRISEMPWLTGHELQGQTVFPAAGYIAVALEAAQLLSRGSPIRLLDMHDFSVHHPLVLSADGEVEVLATLSDVRTTASGAVIQAHFSYSAGIGTEPATLTLMASGTVEVSLGLPSPDVLPPRREVPPATIPVDTDRFYSSLAEFGYSYTGPFRALSSLRRKLGRAFGLISVHHDTAGSPVETQLLTHPAALDSAIQSLLLAHSYPGDGGLWSLHVPASVGRVRVNPALCGAVWTRSPSPSLSFDSASRDLAASSGGFSGEVSAYVSGSPHAAVQIEDVRIVPVAAATVADDTKVFSRMSWVDVHPDAEAAALRDEIGNDDLEFAAVLERVATFYLRKFDQDVPPDHPARSNTALGAYLNFARHVTNLVKDGRHKFAKKQWLEDTLEDVMAVSARFADTPDVKIMHIIGEQMPRVFRQKTTILEHTRPNGLLDDYYVNALGLPQTSQWLARAVAQITDRHPHLDILEVGAGTGGATKSILNKIGRGACLSYTFTDISPSFFENAASTFADHRDHMVFKVFDAERDPGEQGFVANSYDLVVASFVIHATSKLEQAMANIRRLLRPGGFVVLAEITDNEQTRTPFIFGTLPGWWVGIDEGRTLSPCVPPESWDAILTRAGFSGIDTITPDRFQASHPFSVFVSQAIDDRVSFLRDPLTPPSSITSAVPRKPIEHLVIIGGGVLRVSRMANELCNALGPFARNTTVFKSLIDVDHGAITTESTVVSLVDLAKPVFKDMSQAEFDSLKRLFRTEKTLIWVTHGRRAEDPFANMTVGFGRTALCEVPELRLQFLDIESERVGVRAMAEEALRFQMAGFWTKGINVDEAKAPNSLLWPAEPEIILDASGRQLMPRMQVLPAANARYNSARRSVVRDGNILEHAIAIRPGRDDGKLTVTDCVPRPEMIESMYASKEPTIKLRATHALVSAIKTPLGHRFLALGVDSQTGDRYLALAGTLASAIHAPASGIVPFPALTKPTRALNEAQILSLVGTNIVALAALDNTLPGQTVLVHNATAILADALSRRAAEKGINVVYSTSSSDDGSAPPDSWIRLPMYATASEIQTLLPPGDNLGRFVGLSGVGSFASDLDVRKHESVIAACLPHHCRVETAASLLSGNALPLAHLLGSADTLARTLQQSVDAVHRDGLPPPAGVPTTINIVELATAAGQEIGAADPTAVVEWLAPEPAFAPIHVRRFDRGPLFKHDKTYWLAGLSGTLGLSLCDWMVEHGARHVVISSRNPKIDAAWLATHERKGANVYVFPNDITDYDDVKTLHERIQVTLPPLAGVAQGAMVLRDTPIRDMSFEQMTDVLRPKVDGSLNLDRVLGDQQLDWMVFFSSILQITGNIGQANYTAANAFMCSLAAQRRKRGLAASVINIGVIIGVGFVTREVSAAEEKALRRSGLMWLSESDMHQIFAEGIEASRPDSDSVMDIAAGLREIPVNSPYLPTWRNDPKFARFITRQAGNDAGEDASRSGASSIKDRLQAAETVEDAQMVLQEALAAKLRAVLQMDTPDEAFVRMRTDEIGLDSLIAVDIRSWLLQHFEVDVPVLRLLGGISIFDLVAEAVQGLPARYAFNSNPSPEDSVSTVDTRDNHKFSADSTPPQVSSSASSVPATSSVSGDIDSKDREGQEALVVRPPPLERSLSLSFTQSLFWVVDSLVEDKTAPNHTVLMRLVGQPRIGDLRNAVETAGRHHEALRTCFFMTQDQQVVQGVMDSPTLNLEQKKVSGEADVMAEYEALKRHVFDLTNGRLMRIILLSRSPAENWVLVGFHHINMDGLSFQVLMRDLDRLCRGQTLNPQRTLQYPDFSDKQRAAFNNGDWADDIAYWKREFATIPEALPLTRARITTRRPITHFSIHTAHLRVNKALAQRIRDVARANKATSFHFYLTAFQILLHRLTGVEDLAIGIADGGRRDEVSSAATIRDSIGPYVNLVPLRFDVTPLQTFGRLIADTRHKSYAGLAHARVPFDVLLKELQVSHSLTHSPVFQAFVDYRQGAQERQPLGDCTLEMMELQMGSTGYDLSLDVIDNPEGDALVALMGQTSLYSPGDVRIFADMFEDILNEFVQSPSKRISENWQYRQAEVQKALELGQGPLQDREWPETLIEQFLVAAARHDGKTALIHPDGTSLTYRQMRWRLDTIAAALMESGVKAGDSVGVFQESTTDWICSMLAIWKVGAIFVPLDPGTKVERLAMAVGDCRPAVILVDRDTSYKKGELGAAGPVFVDVSTLASRLSALDANAIDVRATPDALAMVYYTSGSTGNPKGIAVRHEGLRAVFEGSCKYYGVDENIVTLVQSSLAFDMSLIQMFISWPVGGTVCMISRDMRGDSVALVEYMVKHGVTHTAGTPSEYTSWLRYGGRDLLRSSEWRGALCGAEAFPLALLESLRELGKDDFRLFHIYGTTETTVYATQQELNWKDDGLYSEGAVPAGLSLPNKTMYIVDEHMHLLPVGLPGEIVLGGVGVAQGYNNNEAMTKRSFVPNVFASENLARRGWTTMYRTKDRGRLLSDGSILVEGRIGDDTEIKLRGLRIDLKDIEQTIVRCAKGVVAEAVVSVRSTAGTDTQFLVAHAVLSPTNMPDDAQAFLSELRAGLSLPQYMLPTVILPIDKMPMTMSSKLDRRAVAALPVTQPDRGNQETVEESLSDEESQLKVVWEEVLPQGMFDITRESDFFHVGGTSLLLVQLQAYINQRFGVSVRLADLFANSMLRPMSHLIARQTAPDAAVSTTIDWEWETRPSTSLRIGTAGPDVPGPAAHPRSVLITGGAGFLGRALIRAAIKNPRIERVHAVAVRKLEERLARGLLPRHPKVTYYAGDLREPRLGLSEDDCARVFTDIDAVLHNGADVSHLKSYFTLRRANLNATKELARLCLPRRIPFHYVSTAGVGMFTFWQTFAEETASAAEPPTDGTNGYKASKWASERFLERLNERLGLPVWMHRPSDMVRYDDEEASWDLLHTLLGYSRKLRAVPLSENLWGWLDLVAVARVATDIVQMAHDNKPRALDGGVSYVHQTGDIAIPIDQMKEFFEEECGYAYTFEKLPIEEWAQRAQAAGMRPAVAAVFGNVPRLARALCFPRFVKTWRPADGQDGGMLLVRTCDCGGIISPVWGEGCPGCGRSPVMPTSWNLDDDGASI
ncbi:Nonribosomal peptide synthetase 14 [Madurella mycetomatis]|uniref:Nonribosomal peptide synthetase 14 n=1 Tax=Madurella mycetomatis TaxID=100816 RepID=A0A175VU15_9PEZI|nr:Nonribosomal peptide synthetase 14 [Madurella mycetomatis]